jgi:hypothetical protein
MNVSGKNGRKSNVQLLINLKKNLKERMKRDKNKEK